MSAPAHKSGTAGQVTLGDYIQSIGEPISPVSATVVTGAEGVKGTAVRYNAGKPKMNLVPLRLIASSYRGATMTDAAEDARIALDYLGLWQQTGDRPSLFAALAVLGLDGWTECAQVFEFGLAKYSPWGWAKGFAWSGVVDSAVRHLMAMIDGIETDPESGKPHRGHVFCNIVMLLTFERTYPEGDDRPRLLA